MKKEGQLIALIGTYSAILLIVCIIGISILSQKKSAPESKTIVETLVSTEEVYIVVGYASPESTANDREVCFVAKEYEEKIGIFNTSGKLLKVIDIYTKTLPKADRILLREGIELHSDAELEALIEDYSS